MRTSPMPLSFLACLALAACLVLVTSSSLPVLVASHFDAGGHADGSMPRTPYVALMLVLAVGVPLLIAVLPAWTVRSDGVGVNLPNKAYWFAPERADETRERLLAHMRWLGLGVGALLVAIHVLVVRANHQSPAVLPFETVRPALLLFGAGVAAWTLTLWWRFRLPR